jgi:formate hydrogenlyase subunit 4
VINAEPLKLFIPVNQKSFQYKIWKLINSNVFETFILALISLNTIALMLKWYRQDSDLKNILKYFNITFTILFSIECVLKLIAYGCLNYAKDAWNIFDFVTVIGSIIDAVVSELSGGVRFL